MSQTDAFRILRRLAILSLLTSCLVLIELVGLPSFEPATASSGATVQAQKGKHKRPTEFKSYNESALKVVEIRNQDSDRWAHDLEVEIKNVSDKPIYYLWIQIEMGGARCAGRPCAIDLNYGDVRMVNLKEMAGLKDRPLQPGERYTLKLPKEKADLHDENVALGVVPREIPWLTLNFLAINFGDGSGVFNGQLYPSSAALQQASSSPSATGTEKLAKEGDLRGSAKSSWSLVPVANKGGRGGAKAVSRVEPHKSAAQTPSCGGSGQICEYFVYNSNFTCENSPKASCNGQPRTFAVSADSSTRGAICGWPHDVYTEECPRVDSQGQLIGCYSQAIDPCGTNPACPIPGETDPHYVCDTSNGPPSGAMPGIPSNGTCVSTPGCGQSTCNPGGLGGVTLGCTSCPPGTTFPVMRCVDHMCVPVSDPNSPNVCGTSESGCLPGVPMSCDPPPPPDDPGDGDGGDGGGGDECGVCDDGTVPDDYPDCTCSDLCYDPFDANCADEIE